MKEVGFKYDLHKKIYYVDRYEDEDVVSDCEAYLDKKMILRYMSTVESISPK